MTMLHAAIWLRLIDDFFRTILFAMLTLMIWRFRRRSLWPALCKSLALIFASGAVMQMLRAVALFTRNDDWLGWPELLSSGLNFAAAYSIARDLGS